MKLLKLTELFSSRDLRNSIVGLTVVVGGLGLSGLTFYATKTKNVPLVTALAVISLVFIILILIFVVPPLVRNAGREASQMNLPFEFTSGGAIMVGLVMIVGFSAWNTGNNLLFLVLSFLLAAIAVSFSIGTLSLKKIDVAMRFPDAVYAGTPAEIAVSLKSRRRFWPAYSIVAEVRGQLRERSIAADDLEEILPAWAAKRLSRPPMARRTLGYFLHIKPQEEVERRSRRLFPNRGRLIIKDFEITTKFPLALFRHRRRLPAGEAELVVLPRLTDIEELARGGISSGREAVNKRGMGQDLISMREYQPQDDLRRIDWKATARSQSLTVREFAAENEPRAAVIFDSALPDSEVPTLTLRQKIEAERRDAPPLISVRFEKAVSVAASLVAQLNQIGMDCCLAVHPNFAGPPTCVSGPMGMRQLATVAPATFSSEPSSDHLRILDDLSGRQVYLLTARPEHWGGENPGSFQIIPF